MLIPLFTDEPASDAGYRNIRIAKYEIEQRARFHCEYLWIFFQHHADRHFRQELRREFNARYWEMYLTTTMILSGYEVTCPKPGPDVGIIHKGQRIWFEATSPTAGAPGSADYIPPPEVGKAYKVPQEKIILRYLSSIRDKHHQHSEWLKKGIVSKRDAFVIALNPRSIPFDTSDTDPPRILQAGYKVGAPLKTLLPIAVVGRGILGTGTRRSTGLAGSRNMTGPGTTIVSPGKLPLRLSTIVS